MCRRVVAARGELAWRCGEGGGPLRGPLCWLSGGLLLRHSRGFPADSLVTVRGMTRMMTHTR